MASTAGGGGYWILNAFSGTISTYGDAVSYGQPADTPAYRSGSDTWPVAVAVVATPTGKGYWTLEKTLSGLGAVQGFGDAVNVGDETTVKPDMAHAGTPVAMTTTSDGKGYWIVDSDGGVFSFGDAVFRGSMGGKPLDAPVVGMAATPDGNGYWLAAADGGVFSFGDAVFGGSLAATVLARPVIGMAANQWGTGYWLGAADGGVFAFGGAPFFGSLGGRHLNRPVFTITALPAPAG
jgi:hypothetical protein